MSVEQDIKNLQGEVYRLREENRQVRGMMGTLTGQGLLDLTSGHGNQRYADGLLKLISGSKRYGYTLNPIGHVGELGTSAVDFLFFQNGKFIPSTVIPYFGRITISDVDAASPTIGIEVRAPAAATMQALIELLPTGIIQFSNGFGASSTTRTFGPTASTENGALVDAGFFQLSGVVSPAQITADQNNYDPGGWANSPPTSRNSWFRLSTDASRTITGLHAPPAGFEQGFVCILHNVGAQDIVLADENASSTDVNRFALSGAVTLAADQVAILQYDDTSNRWRLAGTSGSVSGLYSAGAAGGWIGLGF